MLSDFWIVAQNVLTLFFLIGVGVVCCKTKLLNATAVKACADVVLYFATPCVIIHSCIREFDAAMLRGFLIVVAVAACNHIVLIAAARLIFRDADEARRKVLRYATVFSNAGYMALPLQAAMLGDEGVFYCAAYVIVFNIFSWTYGIAEMGEGKKELSPAKLVLNPGIIAVVVGMAIFLTGLPVPAPIADAIGHLGNLNTPLPMLIVGYYLAQSDLKAALRDTRGFLCIFLRLIAVPAVALPALLLCGLRGNVLISLMICISTPVATATTMFATRYDRNPLLSVNLVSVSTLLSALTMPVIIALAGHFGA